MSGNKEPSIQMTLFDYFMDTESFTLKEAVECVNSVKKVKEPSIRGRIYEGISDGLFKRVSKGVYTVTRKEADGQENTCMLINGNGRDLSSFANNSIDAIITDHPYRLDKALKGGNRDFASYDLFKYEQKDFDEKCRVLKPGAFLLEFLPEESEVNFEYLYQIKKMAQKAGFLYFSKVGWKKGGFVANTGRKAKNREDIMFFSKGEPRNLKLDTKKNKATAIANGFDVKGLDSYQLRDLLEKYDLPVSFMKGTAGMLPADFDFQPRGKNEKVMEAEKPVELFDAILPYISLPGERVLDTFAGSGNVGIAAVKSGRDAILIEKDKNIFEKMKQNIEQVLGEKAVLETDIERLNDTIQNRKIKAKIGLNEEKDKALDTEIDCYSELINENVPKRSHLDERLQIIKEQQTVFYDVNKNEWFNQRKEKSNIDRKLLENTVMKCASVKDMMEFSWMEKNYVKRHVNKENER